MGNLWQGRQEEKQVNFDLDEDHEDDPDVDEDDEDDFHGDDKAGSK